MRFPLLALTTAVCALSAQAEPLAAQSSAAGERLRIEAEGGVAVPFSVLSVGPRAGARVGLLLGSLPVWVALGAGYEGHTARVERQFAPPAGGFDGAVLERQHLLPLELSLWARPLSDGSNALTLGLHYGLIAVWTTVEALGSSRFERGLGHQGSLEVGYGRRFGAVELFLRARLSLRRTAVGERTRTVEPGVYPLLGFVAGGAFGL